MVKSEFAKISHNAVWLSTVEILTKFSPCRLHFCVIVLSFQYTLYFLASSAAAGYDNLWLIVPDCLTAIINITMRQSMPQS